jgi:hypothetical protein
VVRGPGVNNWDISLFKKIKYGDSDSQYIQLRMEAYNAFNHTNWSGFSNAAQINPATGAIVNTTGPNAFGALNSVRGVGALGGPRIISLAAKLYF